MQKYNEQRGIGLLEVMVVLFLTAVLLVLAVPSFKSLFQRNQTKTELSQLQQALQFARSQAILQQTAVTVCPSEDSHQCSERANWAAEKLILASFKGSKKKYCEFYRLLNQIIIFVIHIA